LQAPPGSKPQPSALCKVMTRPVHRMCGAAARVSSVAPVNGPNLAGRLDCP
jgi:hypothetical protein